MANHERTSGRHPQWLHQIPRKRHLFGSQDTDEAFTVSFGSSARNPVDLSCFFLFESTYWSTNTANDSYDKDRANSERVPEDSCSFVFIRVHSWLSQQP